MAINGFRQAIRARNHKWINQDGINMELVTSEEMAAILRYKRTDTFLRAVRSKGIPFIQGAVLLFNPNEVLNYLKNSDNDKRAKSDTSKRETKPCHLKNEENTTTPSLQHPMANEYEKALGLTTGKRLKSTRTA